MTSFQPQRGQSGCLSVTSCGTGQYRAAHATSSANTLCRALTTCSDGEWMAHVQTDVSDRVCKTWTTCTDTQWEVRRPDGTHDRVCQEKTRCRKGLEWELHAASTTSDRVARLQPCPYKLRASPSQNRRAGFKVHRYAFSKQIGRCICICNTHAIDPHISSLPSHPRCKIRLTATTPPATLTNASTDPSARRRACKRWARLTSVVPTTLKMMAAEVRPASLSDAGKRA